MQREKAEDLQVKAKGLWIKLHSKQKQGMARGTEGEGGAQTITRIPLFMGRMQGPNYSAIILKNEFQVQLLRGIAF